MIIFITFITASEARLSSLIVSSGTLSPSFDSDIHNYNVTVTNDVTSVSVTVTSVVNTITSIAYSGASTTSVVSLNVGLNQLTVTVIAEDHVTTTVYTISFTRLPCKFDI